MVHASCTSNSALVSDILATAADLVEERHLGLPDRPRWRRIANGAGAVGDGEPDEVVELQNAGVVVPQLEAEGVGEAHQQQRFRGAVIADEQQRFLGGGSRLASHSRYRDCHGDTSAQALRRARHHAGRREVCGPL
jgi:hypothetical protein